MDGMTAGSSIPRIRLVGALAMLLVMVPLADADACANGHLGVRLSDFPAEIGEFGPLGMYWGNEGTVTNVTVRAVGDDCSNVPISAVYEVRAYPGTAGAATTGDFTPFTKPSKPLYGYHGAPGDQFESTPVTLGADPSPVDTVSEAVQVRIVSANGYQGGPWDVPLYIIDTNLPTTAVAFPSPGPYQVSESRGSITIPVFRGGPAGSAQDVPYTVAGAGAEADRDFRVLGGQVHFDANDRVGTITIELLRDDLSEPAEALTLTLQGPAAEPTSTTIEIVDLGANAPTSTLHHPNNRKRYRANSYKIREIHIFTKDRTGAGVVGAQFALRRNDAGGGCAWFTGRRFKQGKCGKERWLKTKEFATDYYLIRLNELAPSTGSIKNYTAFSRAVDAAGNLEASFGRGRNRNTFEVTPAKS
jgi:hypothetical protein